MAVRITCSSCKSQFTVSDDKRGRKVRCRECEKPIVVPDADAPKKKRDPEEAIQKDRKVRMAADRRSSDDDDDDDDDRPTRKKAAAAKKPVPMMLVVGGIVAVLLLCVVGVGGVAVFGIGGLGVFTLRANKEVENQAQANPKNDGPNVNLLDGKKPPIDPDAGKALPAELPPELVPKLKEATVYLRVTMPSGQVAEGSGFLAVEPGIVITNAHVLGMLGAKSEPPRNVQVVLNSGLPNERMILGDVLGVDRASDLAVVHIKDGNLPAPLQLEMSRQLVETQKVYIFGFPFGEQLGKNITVSASTISSFRTDPSTRELEQIQVNGGMHPGNSGGPVVHAGGKLVGVSVAGIRGTQINFAIPAEKVRLIMDGRLADAKHGEVYMQGAQTMLPVQFNCLDPLNRVRKMHVEVWAGTPGPPRPYSLKQPQAQAGDGKRQAHPMAYQNFGGALDVPMPPLEVGQVCWVQPVITTASGTTHWGNAVPTSVGMVPLERKDADLKVSLTAVTERTVILKNSSSVTIFMGKKKKMIAEVLEGEILESLSFHQKCAFIKTGIGGFNVRAEEDGRAIPLNPEIPPYLRAIPPQFILDETNKLRGRLDRSLGKTKMSPILREQVEDYYSQLCNALEAVNIPMPNRVIRPLESFPTQLPMMLESGKKPEIADLMLTCTYEGVRTRNQRSEALLTVKGSVRGRNENAGKVAGDIVGKVVFDLAGGFIAGAQLKISTERSVRDGDMQVLYSFDIELTRQPGNLAKIMLPGDKKADPPPVSTGKILINQNLTLAQTDPIDPAAKGIKARMKVVPVELQANVTYAISMNSTAFDTYLRLVDAIGKQVAEDDDSGGNLNARIIYRPTQAGTFRIVATSYKENSFGPFILVVQEVVAPKGPGGKANDAPGKDPVIGGRIDNPAPDQFLNGDVTLRHLTFTNPGGKIAGSLVWANDAKSFFMLSDGGLLQRVSLATGTTEKTIDLGSPCGNLAMSGEGLLVSVTGREEVWLLGPADFTIKKKISVPGLKRVTAGVNASIGYAGGLERFGSNASVLDLKAGTVRKEVRMPVRQLTASPDGKYVFVQGNGEDLCRFRVQGDNLFEEQTSFRIASNGQLICISPDSKYVCLCAGGGNGGGHPDHPKTGGYSVFVYPVNDLRKPITGFGAGGYPRCVGIDPKSGVILTQNAGTPLILYPFTGDNKISEHKCPQLKGADVQEFSVSPQGGEAILRTQGSLIHIKINKGSTPPVG